MTEDSYVEAVERLGRGGTPIVSNDVALSASRLADALAGFPGTVARGEEALQRFDDELDALVAPAVALVGVGPDEGLRTVSIALDTLAGAAGGTPRAHTHMAMAVLARAALALTAGALAWNRLEAVARLASVVRSDGYGPAVSVLADANLRHLDVFGCAADDGFRAHVAWYSRRRWRASVGPLSTDGQVELAFAEADVLTGMLAVGTGRDRDLYAAGLRVSERRVEDRLLARAANPRQRPLLRELFGVTEDNLDARLSDAYAGLTAGGSMTSFRRSLHRTEG
jgi:hypothetical protein